MNCISVVIRRTTNHVISPPEGAKGHNNEQNQNHGSKRIPDEEQQQINHGGINQAVNVKQIRDTMADQVIKNRLEHTITLSFIWMNICLLFIQTNEKSSAHSIA